MQISTAGPLFFLLFLSLLYAPQGAWGQPQIYHWVDDKGIQHFSDSPPQHQKPFVVLPKQTLEAPRPQPSSQALLIETTPTQAQVPLAMILAPEEKEDFMRRGIRLDQKVLILFDDVY